MNYNTWDIALRALDAAIHLEGDAVHEYVLFDDGSSTGPPANINRSIRLIRAKENVGFARALRAAFSSMQSEIVVLFDADAYPLTPFVSRVLDRFQNEHDLGQLAFLSQDQKGRFTESFFAEPDKWSLLLGQKLHSWIPHREAQQSSICAITACMATRMKAYDQVGGFDGNFDWLDVDVDYSMRLRKGGWRVQVEPSIRVFHVGGGTSQLQRHRVLRFYKTRWYLLRKHNLIGNIQTARSFILARLRLEQMILGLFGRILFPTPGIRSDKAAGRREVISYCREHYR
jgi:GT2 family glycosyltransferase